MKSIIKKGAVVILAFLSFGYLQSQVTKTMKIDSITVLDPILIGGITNIEVRVRVNNMLFFPDSIDGDIFYYYQTDSMQNALTAPRVFLQDSITEHIVDGFIDTVSIDIQPDEIRTSPPINLIILWPAIVGPEAADSISDSILVGFDGYIGLQEVDMQKKRNVLFPVPAMQYLYVQPNELPLLDRFKVYTLDGRIMKEFDSASFKNGFVSIDDLPLGNYLIEVKYLNGTTVRQKIIKN